MLKAGHCMPISKSCLSTPNLDIYRSHTSTKRKVTSMQQDDDSNLEGKGERKHMRFLFETSTPKAYRNAHEVIDSDPESPILNSSDCKLGVGGSDISNLSQGDSTAGAVCKKTGISQEVGEVAIDLKPAESKSVELNKVLTTTVCWERAAVSNGILRKTVSLPDSLDKIEKNALFSEYHTRQRSFSESDIVPMDLSTCSWSIERKAEEEASVRATCSQDTENGMVLNKEGGESGSSTTVAGADVPLIVQLERVVLGTPAAVLNQRGVDGPPTPKRNINRSPVSPARHRKVSISEDCQGSPLLRKKVINPPDRWEVDGQKGASLYPSNARSISEACQESPLLRKKVIIPSDGVGGRRRLASMCSSNLIKNRIMKAGRRSNSLGSPRTRHKNTPIAGQLSIKEALERGRIQKINPRLESDTSGCNQGSEEDDEKDVDDDASNK